MKKKTGTVIQLEEKNAKGLIELQKLIERYTNIKISLSDLASIIIIGELRKQGAL